MPENENRAPAAAPEKPQAREKAVYLLLGILTAFLAVAAILALISGAMALDPEQVRAVDGDLSRRPLLLIGSTAAAWICIAGMLPGIRFTTAYTRRYLIGAAPKKYKNFRRYSALPRRERRAFSRRYLAAQKPFLAIAAALFLAGLTGTVAALAGAAYHPVLPVLYCAGYGAAGLILAYVSRRKAFWLEEQKIIG